MRKKVFILFSIIIVIVVGGVFMNYNKVQNVYDGMYYTWEKNRFVETSYTNVPALRHERIEGIIIPGDIKKSDTLFLSFDDTFLKENTNVDLWVDRQDKTMRAYCTVHFDGTKMSEDSDELQLVFYYKEKNKTLIIKPIQAISNKLIKKYPEKYEQYEYYSDSESMEMFMRDYSITKKDIEEYKEYFVNEVLIGMWLDGNAKESRFTRDNVGDFVIQDNLFENLSE